MRDAEPITRSAFYPTDRDNLQKESHALGLNEFDQMLSLEVYTWECTHYPWPFINQHPEKKHLSSTLDPGMYYSMAAQLFLNGKRSGHTNPAMKFRTQRERDLYVKRRIKNCYLDHAGKLS